jgi:phage tail sheath protein FI
MPEYLSPGVYVRELPARLKALEGISTSTAGFVGAAERGPVAGSGAPFHSATNNFEPAADPAPVLLTSFADFVRTFGNPLPLPPPGVADATGYLAYAVRAFFDNGGKRCYVSRISNLATATASTFVARQGVALQLARQVKPGDTKVSFTSLRGVNVGDTIGFFHRADGSNALVAAATAATLVGSSPGPFALSDGDTLLISVSGGAPVAMTPIAAAAVRTATAASGPFVGVVAGSTLRVQVGSSAVQTATFAAADVAGPAATAAEVVNVLSRDIEGVQPFTDASGRVFLRTDLRGSAAALAITGGSAVAALGFAAPAPLGPSNVANLDAVTVAEIVAHFAPVGFTVSATGTGALRIASTATGAAVTLAATGTAMAGLFLPAAASGTGGGPGAPLSVVSYDSARNTVTFGSAIAAALDPGETYAIPSGVSGAATGPKFFARSVGFWGANITVRITNSDRAPTALVVDGLVGASTLQVANPNSFYIGAIIELDHDGTERTYHEVADISGRTISLSDTLTTAAGAAGSKLRVVEIDVAIDDRSGAAPLETYRGLSWNQGPKADASRHYATLINARSRLVYVQPPGVGTPVVLAGSEGPSIDQQPFTGTAFPVLMTTVGSDGAPLIDDDYIGSDGGPGNRTGIESLRDVDQIRIIAAPGNTSPAVQQALITQCELLRYRFAVLDAERSVDSVTSILAHRSLYDSSFAAYYTPWLGVTLEGETKFLPPSGAIAGIYARVDNARGVWKAPANEPVANVIALQTNFTTGEQDILNPQGVNVIRRFDEGGILVWGARTLSYAPDLKYINVRRTLIFIEGSIDAGTKWIVFEPNTPDTWLRVESSLEAFLRTQWTAGALFGRGPGDAYFVRCDESTMTADDIENGRLICRIGVAIVRPAEFVIFEIEQLSALASA